MSELLELYYKHRLLKGSKKREIAKEAYDIKRIILTGDGLQPLSEEDIVNQLLKRIAK